jgi:hypothetical protein
VLPSPRWFLCLTRFHCDLRPSPWLTGRMSPFSGSCCLLMPGGLLPVVWGMHPGDKGGDKSPFPQSQQTDPKKCCWNLKMRYRTLRQFSRKQHFIVLAQTQPQGQRSLTLYTLANRLQKQKAKLNPHMVACDFTGYFIPPVLCDLCFNPLIFISLLCHPFPLLHYWNTACFSSGLPSCYTTCLLFGAQVI